MGKRDKKVVGKVIPIRRNKKYMVQKPKWEDLDLDFKLYDDIGTRLERAVLAILLVAGVGGISILIAMLIMKYA